MSYRAGFVGLVGLPNAGKTSLVNLLVGQKVGPVSHKAQTTRQRVVGVSSDDVAQVLWVDAPGYVNPMEGLNRFLHEELEEVVKESDALMAVLNVDESNFEDLKKIIETCVQSGKPWMAVISKVDLDDGKRISILRQELAKHEVTIVEFSIRRHTQKKRDLILHRVQDLIPESAKPLFEGEIYTTANMRDLTAEWIREKCMENLHQEIPYGLAVQIRKFIEGPTLKIYADLIVNKPNHKSIVVGEGGRTIKRIGSQARRVIEKEFGHKVYLELFTRVRPGWIKDPKALKEFGYALRE